MIEIQYIPMRTPDDKLAGHARVQGGFVEVRLRGESSGQALVLTDGGYALGKPTERIRAGGRVAAVAVHAESKLSAVGFAQGSTLSVRDVRRRIEALMAAPEAVSVAETPAVTPLRRAEAEAAPVEIPPAERPGPASALAPRRSARHAPAGTDVLQALERLSQPADAAFFAPEPAKDAEQPRIIASDEAEEERAAAFAALLSRADAVFRRISTPFDEGAPPPFAAPEDAPESAQPMPEDAPETRREAAEAPGVPDAPTREIVDAWSRAVDTMLSGNAAAPAESAMENPFPHIFPGARFAHRGNLYGSETLMGEWERGDEKFHVTAVLGSYSPQPPDALPGFTRYIRTLRGGYWVRVEDMLT